jgi:hypothetical protein
LDVDRHEARSRPVAGSDDQANIDLGSRPLSDCFDQPNEALEGCVKQRRLFQIEHMARLGKERQAGRRKMLLRE